MIRAAGDDVSLATARVLLRNHFPVVAPLGAPLLCVRSDAVQAHVGACPFSGRHTDIIRLCSGYLTF